MSLRMLRFGNRCGARGRRVMLAVATACLTMSTAHMIEAKDAPDYRRADLPAERRVEDLLGRMTLEEKVAQLGGVWEAKGSILDAQGRFDAAKAAKFMPHGIGQIARP